MTKEERLKEVIKYLIFKEYGSSDKEIAKIIGIHHTDLSQMLAGKRTITDKTANKIGNAFSFVNSEWLKNETGEMLKNVSDNNKSTSSIKIIDEVQIIDNYADPVVPKNGLAFYEHPQGGYAVKVRKVPFKAHGAYISEVLDLEPGHDWEWVTFRVDHVGKGRYQCFEHTGESMFNPESPSYYDIKPKDESLCRELGRQHWKDGFNKADAPYGWVLITKSLPYHKDIVDFNKETGDITCRSRNPSLEYSDFTLNLNDVYEIWKIIKVNHN